MSASQPQPSPSPGDIYLDIETDWSRRLTLIGLWSSARGFVQLVGSEITTERLLSELPPPGEGRLYTFNGHCFDLPEIAKQLGLRLRDRHDSRDLRFLCRKYQLTGGQKLIEETIGFSRILHGYDGSDAVRLWMRHLRGDPDALPLLMHYNREDLVGMAAIRDHLQRLGEVC